MSHQIVTPEAHNDMPHQPGLLLRNSRYSIDIKVPKDLRPHLNKEHIREALGTSDRLEAIRLAKHSISHWQAFFDEERRKLKPSIPNPSEQKRLILNIKRTEAQTMAHQYLIYKEAEWREWRDKESLRISTPDQQELMISISMDMQSLTAGVEGYEPNDGDLHFVTFLGRGK